jgi:hypothetical protein
VGVEVTLRYLRRYYQRSNSYQQFGRRLKKKQKLNICFVQELPINREFLIVIYMYGNWEGWNSTAAQKGRMTSNLQLRSLKKNIYTTE